MSNRKGNNAMKRVLVGFGLFFLCPAIWAAASAGSNETKATPISVGSTKMLKLVEEYDPELGEMENAVHYLSVTLKRGSSYTLWLSGENAEDLELVAYPREATEEEWDKDIMEPFAGFDDPRSYTGVNANWLYASDWDYEYDPPSWKYFIVVSGDSLGDQFTINLVEGIRSFVPKGLAENPEELTVSTSDRANERNYTEEGSYYFRSKLTAGRLYELRAHKGLVSVYRDGEAVDDELLKKHPTIDPVAGDTALIFFPDESGMYDLVVEKSTTDTGSNDFSFTLRQVPIRSIANHAAKSLQIGETVNFVPGPLSNSMSYYDEIVDENIYKFKAVKGARYVFETSGATAPAKIFLYSSLGVVIATNETVGNGSYDTRIGFEATGAGDYYVGVCERGLDIAAAPTGTEISLIGRQVPPVTATPIQISPQPATEFDTPMSVGSVTTGGYLDEKVWSQTYQIACRKGVTYVLTSGFATDDVTDLTLSSQVLTASGSKVVSTGSLDGLADEPLTFKATANAMYQIRVSVAEGFSLDYPAFNVYAMAYQEGAELGILTVNTRGVAGQWSLNNEATKYAGGASVLLPTGSYTVKYAAISGFTAPKAEVVSVEAGAEPRVIEGIYNDMFDPKDDTASGATVLSVSNKKVEVARTLWDGDDVDYFAVQGKDGYRYDFALTAGAGAVKMSILDAATGEVVIDNVSEMTRLEIGNAKYLLAVRKADCSDASYVLSHLSANVGQVKWASNNVTARESAESVTLSVSRTGKDGRVRVAYTTVADTAQPGLEYYPTSGILEWAANDNAAKKITVRLIPDLKPTFEANKSFKVRLSAYPTEEELAYGEYPASFANGDTATVTLMEESKAMPGTIRWMAMGKSAGQKLSVTKPATILPANVARTETFWLERADGADGEVSVTVQTVKGTAIPGVDYVDASDTLVWTSGDVEPKSFAVELLSAEATKDKAFTVKLTANRGTVTPKVGAALSVTLKATPTSKALLPVADVGDGEGTTGKLMADLAVGNYTGLLADQNEAATNALAKLASISVTVGATGAISAKVSLSGKTYSFAAKQFDEVLEDRSSDEDPYAKVLGVTLRNTQKIGTTTYTNELQLAINDGSSISPEALGLGGGQVAMIVNVPDANNRGVQEEILYTGSLLRDNSKLPVYTGALRNFGGYYTMALIPTEDTYGLPRGNGYLTLKVDGNTGKATFAGKLPDGTAVSYSAVSALMGDIAESASCTFKAPVFLAKKPMAFGGMIKLAIEEDVPVVQENEFLMWRSDATNSTLDGDPLFLDLIPAGGYYDTVINLQRHYLDNGQAELFIAPPNVDDLPPELVAAGYDYSLDALAENVNVTVSGNKMTVDKQKLVKDAATKLNDFLASVNPANVSLTYVRATGLVSGAMSLWTDNGMAQKQISGAKHAGVMILSKTAGSMLSDDVVTAGAILLPAVTLPDKRKFVYSLPFNLVQKTAKLDWTE